MNSLTHGFLYTVGMGWALCECCVMAGNGSWLPLIAFLAAFVFIFSAIGCLDLSDSATSAIGNIFALGMGFALLAFAVAALQIGPAIFVLKLIGALLVVGTAILGLVPGGKSSHQHG